MAGVITLEVATPERLLLKEQVTEVELPGANGAMGILPDHAPLLSELGSGPLGYTSPGAGRKYMAISGGYVEVLPDHVRVLADKAEFASEIDLARAEKALERANERLAPPPADLDVARALNAMHRAKARIEAAKRTGINAHA
jgi:F-type H+-transporting ATPase subunit epsilon